MERKAERRLDISAEFLDLSFSFDERRTRLWCAAKARSYNRAYGRGGVKIVHEATGVSRRRIYEGLKELTEQESMPVERVRRSGGGRKKMVMLNWSLISFEASALLAFLMMTIAFWCWLRANVTLRGAGTASFEAFCSAEFRSILQFLFFHSIHKSIV